MNPDPNDLPVEASEYLPAVRESQPQQPTTAAQAKTDAVAALTLSAYQRASQLALTDEEVTALLADFPDDAFRPGAAGKENLLYLEHAFIRDRLNTVFRPGQWAIVPRSRWAEQFRTKPSRDNPQGLEASRVYVEAMLCIRGCFAAEAVGEMEYYPHNAGQNYGDAVEGAKTAALRRCAKELGIGLQAWKKDWCDQWWARKRTTMRHQNAPPAPAVPTPSAFKPKTPSPPPQAPKSPPATHLPPPTPNRTLAQEKEHQKRLETWLEQCKASLLKKLEPVRAGSDDYAVKSGMILENENLEDVTLAKLFPSVKWELSVEDNKLLVKKDFDALVKKIQGFMDGDRLPDEGQIPGAEAPDVPPADEWFWDLIVPVPRKGMKRDEYLKAPDTIRSLYDARHGTDEDAQLARERLFGFTNHFQPKGWTKKDGTQMPASEADKKFREALDAFGDFLEKTGEKL